MFVVVLAVLFLVPSGVGLQGIRNRDLYEIRCVARKKACRNVASRKNAMRKYGQCGISSSWKLSSEPKLGLVCKHKFISFLHRLKR